MFKIIQVPKEDGVSEAEQRVVRYQREVLHAKGMMGEYKRAMMHRSSYENKSYYKMKQREYHEYAQSRMDVYRSWLLKLKERRRY